MKTRNIYSAWVLVTGLMLTCGSLHAQTGNVGIGTKAPIEKLHVNGNVEVYDTASAYGSYLKLENPDAVKMTVQSTRSASTYGARGIIGTTSAHPLELIYNTNPVIYMDNGTFAPNGSNVTYLGGDLNRWNGVYAGGVGFDAKNASGQYVGVQTESQNGVQSIFGSSAAASAFGSTTYIGSKTAQPLQLLYNNNPIVYMDNGTIAPNGSNVTYLGGDANRWNGVYAGGAGFDAKNASGQYVGVQTESQNGNQSIFGSSAAASAFGSATYIGSKTAQKIAFLNNNSPVMYMDVNGFYPNGNNAKSLGYTGTAALTQVVAYAFTNPSDIRFKKNIKNLNYGITDIMKIRPVTYDLKDNKNEKLMIGFIAQEMEKIIPEIVSTNKDSVGYKSIDYVKLVPVLTKGIQQQQMVITSQGAELKELKALVEKQGKQITELMKSH